MSDDLRAMRIERLRAYLCTVVQTELVDRLIGAVRDDERARLRDAVRRYL